METNETYQFSTCSKLWKFSNCIARQFSSKRLHIWVYHHNRGKNDSMVQIGFSRRLQKLNNVFVRLLCDFKLHKYATNRKIWQVNLFKREKNPIFLSPLFSAFAILPYRWMHSYAFWRRRCIQRKRWLKRIEKIKNTPK